MVTRDELLVYLNQQLACDSFQDYAPNGLQVEGKADITRICTAVTASFDTIVQAVALNADALLVHHGYFWRGEDVVVTGMKRRRLGLLLQHDMSLLAYHLPLDCHLEWGNNACLGRLLALTDIRTHRAGNTNHLLWSGRLPHPMTLTVFSNLLSQVFGQPPQVVSGSTTLIDSIAWCSGGAQDFIVEAHRLGVDAYISGEISERTYYQAHELGLYYAACGHHATERYGIQALGHHLVERFGVHHHFIDSMNPI
jgi:dinuclear metal center YbgI/SA1388 family protein